MRKFLLFAIVAALLGLPVTADAAFFQYQTGAKGPTASTVQAIAEQEKLAAAGNTEAQYKLGELLFQNYSIIAAKKWLEKAAASGNLLAEARLFYMHNCLREKIDPTKKFHRFDELSEQSSDDAMNLLGDFYLAGCGVTRDRQRALDYFKRAAKNGDPYAHFSLFVEEELFTCIKRLAEQGYAPAQNVLSFQYANGTGGITDTELAVVWARKAIEQGNTAAQFNLGIHYWIGIGVPKDPQQAFSCFQKAAEQGFSLAQRFLGICYESGTGAPKDPQKAVFWYQKAAEQGDEFAQQKLQELK